MTDQILFKNSFSPQSPLINITNAISWDTNTVSNGSLALSAVARDAAGNTTIATAIIVTVNNPIDTTPPAVTAVTPTHGAIDVALANNVTTTIDGTTFELRDPGDNLVAATVSYDGASQTATLNPSGPLTSDKTYTATVKDGIIDLFARRNHWAQTQHVARLPCRFFLVAGCAPTPRPRCLTTPVASSIIKTQLVGQSWM